jgi:hypothetical protein
VKNQISIVFKTDKPIPFNAWIELSAALQAQLELLSDDFKIEYRQVDCALETGEASNG